MPSSHSSAARQAGISNLLYLVLAAAVIAVAVLAFFALREQAEPPPEQATAKPEQQEQQARHAEPPAVKTVDFQQAEIQQEPESSPEPEASSDADTERGLFERGGRARPLKDGLAGGTEAQDDPGPSPQARSRPANAVDAFDYGVLDGRVRIGVFGKSGIPDYKASVSDSQIVIQMPGEFRYVEQFSRTLNINRFGVSSARLARDDRGMRMTITITPALRHEPFLIEDPHGLMVAFEPRR